MKTINLFSRALLIFVLIIGAIIGLGLSLNAQPIRKYDSSFNKATKTNLKNDIRLNVTILLDDKRVETSDVDVSIINTTTKGHSKALINNDFAVFLEVGYNYLITFHHKGYNYRSIILNGDCPDSDRFVINLTMRLYSNQEDDMAGVIYYDKKTDNFEAVNGKDIK